VTGTLEIRVSDGDGECSLSDCGGINDTENERKLYEQKTGLNNNIVYRDKCRQWVAS